MCDIVKAVARCPGLIWSHKASVWRRTSSENDQENLLPAILRRAFRLDSMCSIQKCRYLWWVPSIN